MSSFGPPDPATAADVHAPPAWAGNATNDPAFAPDATVEVADVSVWFGPKVALSELSCSFGPGVTGLLGPNGAGKTTLMRAITGLVGVNQGTVRVDGRDPRRDRRVHARDGAGARGRGGAVRAHRPPASCDTSPTSTASPPATRPTRRCGTVALLDVADRRVDGFSKGMRQRCKIAAALVTRSPGPRPRRAAQRCRPGAAGAPDRPVQAPRRRGPHGHRQLARAQRGRAPGPAGDRADPRPARRRRRPPRDPRRDGRPPAARVRARRRRPSVWPPRSSGSTRSPA